MKKNEQIFGNELSKREIRRAVSGAEKYRRRFGDDRDKTYLLSAASQSVIGPYFGTDNLILSNGSPVEFDRKSLVIGNIRMGFGHYRISMAMASAAHALGYHPYWLDLHSFSETACGKVIRHQNELYSLGSRLSQKYSLFNLYWEKLNSEGFRHLSYNAADQEKAILMAPVCASLPKDIPFIATHVWPAQAAIHAGMTHVVNAIPDNWPMALHLAEGAVHTVQTPSAWLGYKALRGMGKHPLSPMPDGQVVYTGHYVDHELVSNIETDCASRISRMKAGQPRRYLMTVGGAGAGKELFVGMIRAMLPDIRSGRATLWINFGDHRAVYDGIAAEIPEFGALTETHFDSFDAAAAFAKQALTETVTGIHAFCDTDIFAAVYITNLLMRACDFMITKPSELSFYPVPKLMIKRVGGHEAWGAIRAAEVGDGTYECDDLPEILAMISLLQNDEEVLYTMCRQILIAKESGLYNGAYRVIRLATDPDRPHPRA